MTRKYPHAGLPKELFQRLVGEFNGLKAEHNRTLTKHIQEVKKSATVIKLGNISRDSTMWLKSVRDCRSQL